MAKNVSMSISADEHNATRRQKKAAQKANARARQRSTFTPRDAAIRATEAPCLDGLTGVALAVAVGTLETYVSVVPSGGMGRAKAAFEAAKATLPVEDARRYGAVNLGYRKTREALDWAYAQIRTERGLEYMAS